MEIKEEHQFFKGSADAVESGGNRSFQMKKLDMSHIGKGSDYKPKRADSSFLVDSID
jgi:hypothetical protein